MDKMDIDNVFWERCIELLALDQEPTKVIALL